MSNLDIFVRYHVRGNRKIPVGGRCDRHPSRHAAQKDWNNEEQCWAFQCQECFNKRKAYYGMLFQDPAIGGDDVCERCSTKKPNFVELIGAETKGERDVEKEFRGYKDPEDGTLTFVCRPCYSAMSASDAAYWAEPDVELDDDFDDTDLPELESLEESRLYDERLAALEAQQAAEREAWEREDAEREEMRYWEDYSRELRREWDMAQANLMFLEGRSVRRKIVTVYRKL